MKGGIAYTYMCLWIAFEGAMACSTNESGKIGVKPANRSRNPSYINVSYH
jgi:hypothetical protein